ncbi:MAG TPA: tetratricopeptide repeat protein [Candidatus Hydrogenedentes bacterium]|nr:tetratricopeptide repeat protein [Candidatus Hydrogenedentota bacterium]HIJ73797.1 tetratricopeptide repeat protein [Candidatus Hydrogenedentota bacterium]
MLEACCDGTAAEHGELDAAVKYYARSVALDPAYVNGRMNLGKVYMQQKEYDAAVAQFDALAEARPNVTEAHWMAVKCLQAKWPTSAGKT